MAKLNAGGAAVVLSLCVVVVVLACLAGQSAAAAAGEKVDVEATVRAEVEKAIAGSPGVGAALVRLVFHDCWVNGCDGSVLLDRTAANGNSTEKEAEKNIGLAGFGVIDAIKAKLGDNVSCADIVVLAGRDAAAILSQGKITYDVATGRKDGVTSSAAAADATLPGSTFDFDQLKTNFAAKNFTQKELVILSGAHSIGVAHLSSFADRLAPNASPISAAYQTALAAHVKKQRAVQGTQDPAEPNNIRDMGAQFQNASGYDATGVNTTAAGVLDNSYYHANLQNKVLFTSDWQLRNDSTSRAAADINTYRNNATKWFLDFGNAMAKLSELPADGSSGRLEIRKSCRVTNQN